MHNLIQSDRKVFYIINHILQNPVFDLTMPLLRNSNFWVPLYLFLFVFVLSNYKKNIFLWICFAAALVTLTDFVSSDLIKNYFFRLRPCNDMSLVPPARWLLSYKPQSSSFTSSHATNHFAMAVFFYYTLRNTIGKWGLFFFYGQLLLALHRCT